MAIEVDMFKKVPVREQDPQVRATNFEEVCLGYNDEEAQAESTRCLNCKNARCIQGCPVNINIPAFIQEVKAGNVEGAYNVISESSALPAVCGRVCPQETQCEGRCVRGIKGEAVSIGKLERYVADKAKELGIKPVNTSTPNGKKIAVIGAGPSGLTCAGDLDTTHGVDADCIQGARSKDLLIMLDEMKEVCGNLYCATDDGSYGVHGTGSTALQQLYDEGKRYDHCVIIGPMIMMKFTSMLTAKLGIPTVVSMNTVMVDGTGMCGACRLLVGGEVKFACVDGPEFDGALVDYDNAMLRGRLYKTQEGRLLLEQQEGETHEGGCGQCK